jgi:hypothetical protein
MPTTNEIAAKPKEIAANLKTLQMNKVRGSKGSPRCSNIIFLDLCISSPGVNPSQLLHPSHISTFLGNYNKKFFWQDMERSHPEDRESEEWVTISLSERII